MGENRWSLPVIILITLLIVVWVCWSIAGSTLRRIRESHKIIYVHRLGDNLLVDVWASGSYGGTAFLVESETKPLEDAAHPQDWHDTKAAEINGRIVSKSPISQLNSDTEHVRRCLLSLTGIEINPESKYWLVAVTPAYESAIPVTEVVKSGMVYTAGIGQHWPFRYIIGAALLGAIIVSLAFRAIRRGARRPEQAAPEEGAGTS